jgi:hypothetical protein
VFRFDLGIEGLVYETLTVVSMPLLRQTKLGRRG